MIKQFRKAWERNDDGTLDKVMKDYIQNPHRTKFTMEQEIENDN